MAQLSARRLAWEALARWRKGREFADAIQQSLLRESGLAPSDRAFATELFYGVLRNLTLLDFFLAQLRNGHLDARARDLLRLGLYQLLALQTPEHAAVFETVKLAPVRARALVNAVLRSAIRRRDELQTRAAQAPLPVRFSHPAFLVARWEKAFGATVAAELCAWNNQPAKLFARVNHLRISEEDFFRAHPAAEHSDARADFALCPSLPLAALERGECYMQDPSTARACDLLAPRPGETVLDACAAPGGKTALLAQWMENRGRLVACDRDPDRVAILRENMERLGVRIAELHGHDWIAAQALPGVFPEASFDRILVDAPCSNTGVMQRRIDVRWRLRPTEFLRMQTEQRKIIAAVVPLLKPGGVLVYSTCSLEPEENAAVLAQIAPPLQLEVQTETLPWRDLIDGAFAARLRKA